MEECVDGDYQRFKAKDGASVREQFFGKSSELKALVADLTDDEFWSRARGGKDPIKVYAAYAAAGAPSPTAARMGSRSSFSTKQPGA